MSDEHDPGELYLLERESRKYYNDSYISDRIVSYQCCIYHSFRFFSVQVEDDGID